MNWEVIKNERSSLMEYRLIDDNECKVVIKYNPRHQSARITSGNHHRLFYFESTGSFAGKTIFKNEYGMEIGNVAHNRMHSAAGTVVIDSKQYQYHLENTQSAELVIYENDPNRPVASCGIPSGKGGIHNEYAIGSSMIDDNCYLLGLCWYLYLPTTKEVPQLTPNF